MNIHERIAAETHYFHERTRRSGMLADMVVSSSGLAFRIKSPLGATLASTAPVAPASYRDFCAAVDSAFRQAEQKGKSA